MWLNVDVAVLLTVLALCLVVALLAKRRVGFGRSLAILLLVAYAGAVVAVTQFPFPVSVQPGEVYGTHANIVPFKSILDTLSSHGPTFARQVLGNVALFVPLGFLVPGVFDACRRLGGVALVACSCSVLIELIQLLNGLRIGTIYRIPDIDDVILNVAGALVGYGLWLLACGALGHEAAR